MNTVITNIEKIVSGNIRQPFLYADTILIENGIIKEIGTKNNIKINEAEKVINVNGMIVAPGLIDSHCHLTIGDYSPRTKTIGYLENELEAGVTTVISAGECHIPGRPVDPAGVKALAILASRIYKNYRPGGIKVIGGAVILEKGLTEADFKEMSENYVRIVGEIGMGSAKKPEDVLPMVKWAKKYGMIVQMHVGGASFLCNTVTAEDVLRIDPNVASHINGGCTALATDEIEKIVNTFKGALEIVENGNLRAMLHVEEIVEKRNELNRIIIGTDTPSGYGTSSRGILRVIAQTSSVAGIPPEKALALATGNTSSIYRLNTGLIEVGMAADLIVIDTPVGSPGRDALEALEAGNVPGIALVMIDGEVKSLWGTNTEPPVRKVKMEKI